MSDIKRFIKSSGIYFIGSILSKLILFFILPVYTKFLTPTDYGKFDLSITYMNFFIAVCFIDIHVGVMKFLLDSNNQSIEYFKEKILFAGFFSVFISSLLYFISFSIFLSIVNIEFVFLILLAGFTSYMQLMYGYICRSYQLNFIFMISGLANTVVNVFIVLILLIYYNFNYEAMFIGIIVGNMLNVFIIESQIQVFRKIKLVFLNFLFLKKLVFYSFPLIFSGLSYYFVDIYGKYMISYYISLNDNGYYAIALRFASIFSLMMYCFKLASQEIIFSKSLSKNDSSIFYTNMSNEYIQFLFLSSIVLLPLIKIIFPFFVDKAFLNSHIYIPFIVFLSIIVGFYEFLLNIINKINYNKYISIFSFIVAIVNIVFIYLFIANIGVFAVIFASILSYFIVIIILLFLINKNFLIYINFKRSFLLFLLFFFQGLVVYNLDVIYNIFSLVIFCLIYFIVYGKKYLKMIK